MTATESTGVNLLLAVRDYALVEAAALEKAAAECRSRAAAMEGRAGVLRQIYAVAAPHFPETGVRLLAG